MKPAPIRGWLRGFLSGLAQGTVRRLAVVREIDTVFELERRIGAA